MKTTLGCLRKADTDFHLIEPGDRVAVGVSGGKDSLLLLHALSLYRKFSHKDFALMAFTISMGLEPFDLSGIHRLCQELDIPYVVKQTEIGDIIFNKRKEKNPCALCAKMRRGALNDMCREYGCNKLALGHHRDDAIETLLMSLFYEGRFHTFHPKTYLSRTGITAIRPLCYLPEYHVRHMVQELNLPVVKSPCPANGETKRQEMKELMQALRKRYPDAPDRFLHALQSDKQYDLWQKE
ncbi:MAG TPA: tRNA 2-thiocytidine biosynthesis protein TtcA [Candidatus Egerieenecus merdigallinarum]|nr:tRNA 2-thiocytidine biosynthesis protein TtcA [Candidatus Egerieenecus merdigallinarum]